MSITTALGCQYRVRVVTYFCSSQWLLVLTISITDSLYSKCAGELFFYELPIVTLDAHHYQPQRSLAKISLLRSASVKPEWQSTWTTIYEKYPR